MDCGARKLASYGYDVRDERGTRNVYTAWIDESESNSRLDPGTYLLGAAIIETGKADIAREAMRGLLLPGQRKLHWSDEHPRRRAQIVKVVAHLDVEHLVAVRCQPGTEAKPERQRRLCWERLLPELHALGVEHVVVESRGSKADKRDRAALDNLRRKHLMPPRSLRMNHLGGPADPLLWIPDACCGAVTERRCGNSENFGVIGTSITMLDVDR